MALAFLTVIAVSVSATVWFTHRGSGGQAGSAGGSSQASDGGIASAGDTGPVGIITEDPTCDEWRSLASDLGVKLESWNKRDPSIPADAWTPEMREMYESAKRVLADGHDKTVQLARKTPHRVVRELYEQEVAYGRAYVDSLSNYTAIKNNLALVSTGAYNALGRICDSISNLAAADRAGSVAPAQPPTSIAPLGDPADPQKFLPEPSPQCPAIQARAKSEESELAEWYDVKTDVPATQWSAADKVLWNMAAKVFDRSGDELERIGRASGNPVMEDFLVLSAQYYRASASAIPTYTAPDWKLVASATKTVATVFSACNAVQA